MALPKKHRLLLTRERTALLKKQGKRTDTPFFTVFTVDARSSQPTKYAVVAGAIVSKKAAVRNRLRRIVHEAIRESHPPGTGKEILIYLKKRVEQKDTDVLKRELRFFFKKTNT